jgi:hypothetical protein
MPVVILIQPFCQAKADETPLDVAYITLDELLATADIIPVNAR